jgi:hypothetical protein
MASRRDILNIPDDLRRFAALGQSDYGGNLGLENSRFVILRRVEVDCGQTNQGWNEIDLVV